MMIASLAFGMLLLQSGNVRVEVCAAGRKPACQVEKWMVEREDHRRALYWALRTRVLTAAEMDEVAQRGEYLVIPDGTIYNPDEVRRAFNDALFQQFKMLAASHAKACGKKADQP